MAFRTLRFVLWLVAFASLRGAENDALLEPVRTIENAHPRGVSCLRVSPGGDELLSTGHSLEVKFWKIADGAPVRTLPMNAPGRALAFSPSGKRLAAGGGEFAGNAFRGGVTLWEVKGWREERRIAVESADVNALTFIDEQTLVGCGTGGVRVWNANSGELLHHLPTDAAVLVMDYSAGQHLIGIGTFSTSCFLIDTREWKVVRELRRDANEKKVYEPRALAFVAGGLQLRVGSWGLVGWEAANGNRLEDIPLDSLIWACVPWSERRLIAGGGDPRQPGRLWVCDSASGKVLQSIRAHGDALRALTVNAAGDLVFSGGADGSICFWKAKRN